jgi:hypothetical protein
LGTDVFGIAQTTHPRQDKKWGLTTRRCRSSNPVHASLKKHASNPKENSVNINLSIGPLISLIAGILILTVPRLLNYIVAIYLIAMGLIGLFGSGHLNLN